jgi:hypothetical protein
MGWRSKKYRPNFYAEKNRNKQRMSQLVLEKISSLYNWTLTRRGVNCTDYANGNEYSISSNNRVFMKHEDRNHEQIRVHVCKYLPYSYLLVFFLRTWQEEVKVWGYMEYGAKQGQILIVNWTVAVRNFFPCNHDIQFCRSVNTVIRGPKWRVVLKYAIFNENRVAQNGITLASTPHPKNSRMNISSFNCGCYHPSYRDRYFSIFI